MAARNKLKLTESIDGYTGCLTGTKSYLGKNNFKQLRHERGTLINGGPLTPGNCLSSINKGLLTAGLFFHQIKKNSVCLPKKLSSIFAQNSVFWRKNSVTRSQNEPFLLKTQFFEEENSINCAKLRNFYLKRVFINHKTQNFGRNCIVLWKTQFISGKNSVYSPKKLSFSPKNSVHRSSWALWNSTNVVKKNPCFIGTSLPTNMVVYIKYLMAK